MAAVRDGGNFTGRMRPGRRLRRWCRGLLRRAGLFTVPLERRLARRVCRELLLIYREVERELPALGSDARYLEVVTRHLRADAHTAAVVLERAAASFTEWPQTRRLRLRDVVHYLAARECLDDNPQAIGLLSHVPEVVARHIPPHL